MAPISELQGLGTNKFCRESGVLGADFCCDVGVLGTEFFTLLKH